jgi:hypothetical protein
MALVLGGLATLLCLGIQAFASMLAARYFARRGLQGARPESSWGTFANFSILMTILTLGIVVQIGIWALLYRALGAFEDLETATYFSGVTFTTLGYGDVLLKGRMRLLTPLEAANGVMMFGVTMAVFMAAVQRAMERWREQHPPGAHDGS